MIPVDMAATTSRPTTSAGRRTRPSTAPAVLTSIISFIGGSASNAASFDAAVAATVSDQILSWAALITWRSRSAVSGSNLLSEGLGARVDRPPELLPDRWLRIRRKDVDTAVSRPDLVGFGNDRRALRVELRLRAGKAESE